MVNHREGEGTAPRPNQLGKLGYTGGNTSSRHRMGHVELPNPGHKLHGRKCDINVVHARQPFVFGRVFGDHFNARKTAQNREFSAAALPVGPVPRPVMGGRAAEPTSWAVNSPYSGVVSDIAHSEADFPDLQVTLIITTKLLLIQSDLLTS